MSLARRLGSRNQRRRRHVKVAIAALVLCVAGAVLLVVDRHQADGGPSLADIDQACAQSNDRLAALTDALLGDLPESVDPVVAFTGFLQDAFVDFLRTRADTIDALHPPGDVAALVQEWRTTADAIEANPSDYASNDNPFSDLNDRFAQAGLPDCGIAAATVPSDAGSP